MRMALETLIEAISHSKGTIFKKEKSDNDGA
jgi:hypothetical protein